MAVQESGSTAVAVDEIFDVDCDIFAPCAMGHVLNERTIARLRCGAVVGSANNQLATDADADRLIDREITYAPDFVVNAGGIINIAEEVAGYSKERAAQSIDRIGETVTRILDTAAERRVTPHEAAVELADERIAAVGTLGLRRRGGKRTR
jgi:leucine dehydrogenase